jgi:hypothetical protein
VNWPQNDYLLGNLFGDPDPAAAAKHVEGGRELSRCLFYWMQTEAPRPDGGQGWKGLRLRPELTGTDDGMAMAPYVRESRRIKAAFTVTENHVGTDARAAATGKPKGEFTAEPFADTVGVGSYRIDLHPSTGGVNYIDVSSLPFQIPLGRLLPQRITNLIAAAKNIGTTHITNGLLPPAPGRVDHRRGGGRLAAFCLARKAPPAKVRETASCCRSSREGCARRGFELEWPEDVAKKPR